MTELIDTKKVQERAVLVGVIRKNQNYQQVNEYLEELAFLTDTAGAIPVKTFIQQLDVPVASTYIGTGKTEEIKNYIENNDIDIVIFDDELSPTQLRNLERIFKRKIIDRTNLILDIFAKRAKTAHAKAQVELAQYQYLLPRLTRMWTHLERQRGGIGLRGPGETEIETDRRIIRDKISRLKKQLEKIDVQKLQQRKNRGKLVRISLIGYTNAGKSTLMNLLSKSNVFAENKLFATLDTTVRKVVIENLPVLLSDTVGFIRKLPHHLIESFKSTLDEVRESDILLHVIDISHPHYEEHINVVENTLYDILKEKKKTIYVFNKIDAFSFIEKDEDDLTPIKPENISLNELKNMWIAKNNHSSVFISAKYKENIDVLKKIIYKEAAKIHAERYPYDDFLYPMDNL
ncbi:MAG: GTPase HflX [Marinilabiliales bacterium]